MPKSRLWNIYKKAVLLLQKQVECEEKAEESFAFLNKKYAGSYHTMILLGVDEEGQVVLQILQQGNGQEKYKD